MFVDLKFWYKNDLFFCNCNFSLLTQELFHPSELMAMVVGNQNYDFIELEKVLRKLITIILKSNFHNLFRILNIKVILQLMISLSKTFGLFFMI